MGSITSGKMRDQHQIRRLLQWLGKVTNEAQRRWSQRNKEVGLEKADPGAGQAAPDQGHLRLRRRWLYFQSEDVRSARVPRCELPPSSLLTEDGEKAGQAPSTPGSGGLGGGAGTAQRVARLAALPPPPGRSPCRPLRSRPASRPALPGPGCSARLAACWATDALHPHKDACARAGSAGAGTHHRRAFCLHPLSRPPPAHSHGPHSLVSRLSRHLLLASPTQLPVISDLLSVSSVLGKYLFYCKDHSQRLNSRQEEHGNMET
ncbi:uncharacterized protein LOC121019134 [Herpailurus yagouaroundi]|uniref:uncharacterized protein LOC121019134 n=1 Tax=Herpailurus yagouaroundi TaxID=1608482 RepID=UPI001AD6731E|nr:uncharacterized protein LOC121019134 [Puma yagouaroundi]